MKHRATRGIAAPHRDGAFPTTTSGGAPGGLTGGPAAHQCNAGSGTASPLRILVIEDEPKTAASLRKGLCEEGFAVDFAGNGRDGLFLATHNAYHVVILDVMLPVEDGWSVLTKMRDSGQCTPVMFLTACDSASDRSRGLALGADDYLVKPFSFSELLARVRALSEPGDECSGDFLRVADLELDLVRHRVTRLGLCIFLTPKEFALLSLLASRAGEVLSRSFISQQVWGMDSESDSSVVDTAIRRLRGKVDGPFGSDLIRPVRGVGYVLGPH